MTTPGQQPSDMMIRQAENLLRQLNAQEQKLIDLEYAIMIGENMGDDMSELRQAKDAATLEYEQRRASLEHDIHNARNRETT